ncbi:MAG: FecR domain-containing protein [Verrucomicrobia bacterium]|nr:FecR domain-containing protein [Verrucomicrobiota bacterium]
MNTPDPQFPLNDAIESAAAEWLVRHDRGLTPAQQDEFLSWLTASAAHRASFERHRRLWGDFNALAQWRPEHGTVPNPDLLARHRRPSPWRWAAPALLAAAAVALLLVWSSANRAPNHATLAFEATTYRQETLSDGSVLDLNRGAHVVVQFTAAERRVLLVQGEAQFAVAKNPARPFVVRAAGVEVRAVGTAFNVKLAGPNLEVLVTEGTVHVSQQTVVVTPTSMAAGAAAGSAPSAAPVVLAALTAGQRTVIPVATVIAPPVVVPASVPEIARLLDWQPRLLDFESTPLAEVVETFNRRNPQRLVIGDEELRALTIVASIRSDNVEGFVRLLEGTMGVRADRSSTGEIVLRRAR